MKRFLKTYINGHFIFILFIVTFHIWFFFDIIKKSTRMEHLLFVLPLVTIACVLGVVIIYNFKNEQLVQPSQNNQLTIDKRIPLLMLALCGYILGLIYVGFDISTFLFLACSLWLMGERKFWVIFPYSIALTILCVFGLREMVSIPFPTLFFPEL